ncbi:MAG: PAS domain-containing protein, partial [Bacteroidota bacterium]
MPDQSLINTNSVTRISSNNGYPKTSITDTFINGFFTVDRKWTVQYWNKAAEKILGVPAKDIIGKNLWEKFAGIIPLNFYSNYNKAFLQDIPFHFQEYWAEL